LYAPSDQHHQLELGTATGTGYRIRYRALATGQLQLHARPAQTQRGVDEEVAAIERDRLTHHRQPQPMTRHLLVGAHATLNDAHPVGRGDARTVVLDHDRQPLRQRARAIQLRTDRDARAAPFAGVIEHVTEQLEDIAGIAEK